VSGCYQLVSIGEAGGVFCACQSRYFCLYSSHTQGLQLPPPQHSSGCGFWGLRSTIICLFCIKMSLWALLWCKRVKY